MNLPTFSAPQKKRGCYHVYDAKTRATTASATEELGLARAVLHLQKALGHQISKSTIQSIRDSYRRRISTYGARKHSGINSQKARTSSFSWA